MKFLPLVWAMLWRSRARTWLTFLSIVVAFLLYALLQSVGEVFDLGARVSGDDRLVVTYRQGLTRLLPLAYRDRIEAIDGVRAVTPVMFLGGYYQDPKSPVQIIALDPRNLREVDPRLQVPDDQLAAFVATRTGALAGRELARVHGWKVGDRVPITGTAQRKDGAQAWPVDIVGIYRIDPRLTGRPVPAQALLIGYDYFSEATAFASNMAVWFNVRVRDAKQADAIGRAIDREFRNSELETRTQSEADFNRGIVRRLGNVGKMMSAILAAVFFTLALVAGNTMMQAFRERVPELAVLKTLGFGNARVAALIALESLLLCVLGAAIGLALTTVLARLAAPAFANDQLLAALYVEPHTVARGLLIALALGALAAAAPALRCARLTVVEGLRAA